MKVLTLKDFKYLIDNLFKNKTSLDKVSESEEGVLLFDGEEISGGSGSGIQDWISGTIYETNTLILYDNKIFKSVVSPQEDSSVFNEEEWVAISSNSDIELEVCTPEEITNLIDSIFQ